MRKPDGVLYVGPVRVPILINFYGGILAIGDFEKKTILGYPSLCYGTCVLRYKIGHLHPMMQAAFRTPKVCNQWTTYMLYDDDLWLGAIEYIWDGENEVLAHLIRQ